MSPEQTVLCFHEHGGMPRMQQAGIMSRLAATVLALAALMVNASAQDTLKVATAQRGAWESAVPELGQQAGIFKKHGISLDLVHTRDAAETEQRVVAGSVDVGLGVEVMGVLRAYARNAPVRIIGANTTGTADYWYVPASSSVKTVKDIAGKTIAFSTHGSFS